MKEHSQACARQDSGPFYLRYRRLEFLRYNRAAMKPGLWIIITASAICCAQTKKPAWTPENEVQKTAEALRAAMNRDFAEVVEIRYKEHTAEEKDKLVAQQVEHAKSGTELTRQFASALGQAISEKRCLNQCKAAAQSLAVEFSDMSEALQRLNKKEVDPEMLAAERIKFQIRSQNARRLIRSIHLSSSSSAISKEAEPPK